MTETLADAAKSALDMLAAMRRAQAADGCAAFYCASVESGLRVIPGQPCGARCSCAAKVAEARKIAMSEVKD